MAVGRGDAAVMPDDRVISKFLFRSVEHGECLLFLRDLDRDGYGVFRQMRDGKRVKFKAHRVVYQWFNGDVPEGLVVRHTCDNRPCVNIAHLMTGTQAENLEDMRSRGRLGSRGGKGKIVQPYQMSAILE